LKQRKNLFEKGEGISIVKERKKRGTRICSRKIEGGIYLTLKITANCIYVFVGKKDGKKHMVQDYRYLNEWTVKNNYPLPLILDIVENIDTQKVFTKIDLRWKYNNV